MRSVEECQCAIFNIPRLTLKKDAGDPLRVPKRQLNIELFEIAIEVDHNVISYSY